MKSLVSILKKTGSYFKKLQTQLSTHLTLHKAFYFPTLIFLLGVLIIAPWGEFAINDDWDFFLHVREFSEGHLIKNSLVDSVLLLQAFVAVLWAKLFGLTFSSLRVLTLIVTVFAGAGIYKILQLYNRPLIVSVFTLLLFYFNPFVNYSAMTFMTENYFLACVIWSVYFFLKYLFESEYFEPTQTFPKAQDIRLNSSLIFSLVFATGSLLIRQFGVVLFLLYFLVLAFQFLDLYYKQNHFSLTKIIAFIVTLGLGIITYLIASKWPQYEGDHSQRMADLLIDFSNVSFLAEIFWGVVRFMPYFAFFYAPFLIYFNTKISSINLKVFNLVPALIFASMLFPNNIFSVLNIFFPEGFHAFEEITADKSLFSTNLFKLVFSVYVGWLLVLLLEYISYRAYRTLNLRKVNGLWQNTTLLLGFLGMLLIVLITKDYFDRYIINAFVFGLLFFGINGFSEVTVDSKLSRWSFIGEKLAITFMVVYVFSVSCEFFKVIKLKWELASYLEARTSLTRGIFVSNPYLKYKHVSEITDFKDVSSRLPSFQQYKCFVQSYSVPLFPKLEYLLDLKFTNLEFNIPFVEKRGAKPYIKIEDNLHKLIENREYFSPMKHLAFYRTYVGSYCVKGVVLK